MTDVMSEHYLSCIREPVSVVRVSIFGFSYVLYFMVIIVYIFKSIVNHRLNAPNWNIGDNLINNFIGLNILICKEYNNLEICFELSLLEMYLFLNIDVKISECIL